MMSNPLYNALNGQAQMPMVNLQNALSQLRSNPSAILRQAGLNIPEGMNDPQAIIGHLIQSGQINQSKLAQAQQMAASLKK